MVCFNFKWVDFVEIYLSVVISGIECQDVDIRLFLMPTNKLSECMEASLSPKVDFVML